MKRVYLILCALACVPLGAAVSAAEAPRLVGPTGAWSEVSLADYAPHRLYVKFAEGLDVVSLSSTQVRSDDADLSFVNSALARYDAQLVRTFDYEKWQTAKWKADGESRAGVTGPDLALWYTLTVDADRVATWDGSRRELAELLGELNDSEAIEIAHPSPRVGSAAIYDPSATPVEPPRSAGGTPDYTMFQDYLYAPPVGLNAPAIWSELGGTGTGMRFIDVEAGWTPDHEDFNSDNFFFSGGTDEDFGEPHGTAVLGEVVGQDNTFGIRGFAPDTEYGVEAIDLDEYPDVSQYFQEAVDNLRFGDVWLIELQMFPAGLSATPMEWLQVNFDVIWTSVFARGITCVEAGANGGQDLDSPAFGGLFDLSLRDSGAILVGAGTPTGLVAEGFSNYGSRVDCHAWGSQIYTTGYGDLYNEGPTSTHYTSGFGGTSGASPMVVGSVLCLQGVSRAETGEPEHPLVLRTILRNTGTPFLGTRHIGPRPNLEEALAQLRFAASTPEIDTTPRLVLSAGPNPFRERTSLRFELDRERSVELFGYDASGREIATILRDRLPAGPHSIHWSLSETPAGVVFVRMHLDGAPAQSVALRVLR